MIFRPDIKPPMWGSPEAVRYAVRANCEEMGLDYNDLAMYLPFWEQAGLIARDVSKYRNDGVLSNGPVWKDQGLFFDGVNDYIKVQHSASLIKATNQISVFYVIKLFPGYYGGVISKNYSSSTGYYSFVGGHADGASLAIDIGGYKEQYTTEPLDDGFYYHWSGVYTGSKINIYNDGKLKASKAVAGNITQSTLPLYIGALSGSQHFLKAHICEIFLYNKALNQDQISLLNAQPYRLLMPVSRPVYFGAGSAPSGTLYSQNISGILGNLSGTTNETISYTLLTEGQI